MAHAPPGCWRWRRWAGDWVPPGRMSSTGAFRTEALSPRRSAGPAGAAGAGRDLGATGACARRAGGSAACRPSTAPRRRLRRGGYRRFRRIHCQRMRCRCAAAGLSRCCRPAAAAGAAGAAGQPRAACHGCGDAPQPRHLEKRARRSAQHPARGGGPHACPPPAGTNSPRALPLRSPIWLPSAPARRRRRHSLPMRRWRKPSARGCAGCRTLNVRWRGCRSAASPRAILAAIRDGLAGRRSDRRPSGRRRRAPAISAGATGGAAGPNSPARWPIRCRRASKKAG